MQLSATGGLKTRAEARKVSGIGKIWKPGDILDVAYPIFWDKNKQPQVLVGQAWGHPLDPKQISLRKVFWPTHSEIIDGEPTIPDLAYRFARIARLIQEGDYNLQRSKIETSALKKSEQTAALRKIDKDFAIDPDTGRITQKPVVGNLKFIITTEVLAVPLKEVEGNLVPEITKARVVSQDLSDKKIRYINNLMLDTKFKPTEGSKFYWVRWAFGTDEDKKISGNVAPQGLEASETISVKFPEDALKLKDDLDTLPETSEMIMKRNGSFAKGSEADLAQAIMTFYVTHEDMLEGLTEEEDTDRLKKVAETVHKLHLPVKNPILLAEIAELKESGAFEEGISTDPYNKEKAPSINDVISKDDIDQAKDEAGVDEDETADMSGVPDFAGMENN